MIKEKVEASKISPMLDTLLPLEIAEDTFETEPATQTEPFPADAGVAVMPKTNLNRDDWMPSLEISNT